MALLNSKTYGKVKALTKKHCANYVNGECILHDEPCDYFKHRDTSCDYFEECVLPNDPLLEQAYKEQNGIGYVGGKPVIHNIINCKNCGNEFVKGSNRALYCTCCKKVKQREHARNYYRRKL